MIVPQASVLDEDLKFRLTNPYMKIDWKTCPQVCQEVYQDFEIKKQVLLNNCPNMNDQIDEFTDCKNGTFSLCDFFTIFFLVAVWAIIFMEEFAY